MSAPRTGVRRRVAAATTALLVAALGIIFASGPAEAATVPTVGTLTIEPLRGVTTSSVTVTTSHACPSGTFGLVRVFGAGFPKSGQNVTGSSQLAIYPTTSLGGYSIPLQNTLQHFLDLQNGRHTFVGTYRLAMVCRNAFGPDLAAFSGTLTFAKGGTFTAKNAKGAPTSADATGVPTPAPSVAVNPSPGANFPGAPGAAPGTPGPRTIVAKALSLDNRLAGIPVPFLVLGAIVLFVGTLLLNRDRGSVDGLDEPEELDEPEQLDEPEDVDEPQVLNQPGDDSVVGESVPSDEIDLREGAQSPKAEHAVSAVGADG